MGRRVFLQQPPAQGHGKANKPRNLEPTMFEALAWINDPRPATSSGWAAQADSDAKATLIDPTPPAGTEATAAPAISVEDISSQDAVALAPRTEPETLESTEEPTMQQRPQRRPKKAAIHARKADFHTYGRENVEPVNGGIVYGDYLVSHNVRAHRSDVREVFPGALRRIGIAMPPTRQRGLRGRTKSSKRRSKSERHVKTAVTPAPAIDPLTPTAPAVQFNTANSPKPAQVPAGIRYLRSTNVADCLVW